jgi:hypothetical protein
VTLENENEVIHVADMMETLSGLVKNPRLKLLGEALNIKQVLKDNVDQLSFLQKNKL